MNNKIERYGRPGDKKAILPEMPVLGQRQILQPLNNFFVQHMSDQIQVTYVIQGCIDFTIDGCIYAVKQGDIIINKPGQVFGALNETFPQSKTAFFKIDLSSAPPGWDDVEKETLYSELKSIIIPHFTPSKEFYTIFLKILNEHRSPGLLSSIKCRSCFQSLLVLILEDVQVASVAYSAFF